MKVRVLLTACSILVSAVLVSHAAVTFKVAPTFNTFTDSRISGMGTAFSMMFDLDKVSAGYRMEQQNLSASDAQQSANTFQVNAQISSLIIEKDIIRIGNEFPVNIGLEVGSAQLTAMPGTVAIPAGISQTVPVLGVNGGIKYDSVGKSIVTSLFLNLGYRFMDIKDTAIPGGFTAGGNNFKDLNALRIELGVGLGF